MKKIIKEQQRISKHKIEEWQPPHLTLQKSKGVFKQPHFQSAGDLIHTVIYCVCTFSAAPPRPPLFFCSIVTFFLACNKRNLMPKPYMQISFSLWCVLGRGGMIGEIHGGKKAIYCKELLYSKVILVFQGKGTSS